MAHVHCHRGIVGPMHCMSVAQFRLSILLPLTGHAVAYLAAADHRCNATNAMTPERGLIDYGPLKTMLHTLDVHVSMATFSGLPNAANTARPHTALRKVWIRGNSLNELLVLITIATAQCDSCCQELTRKVSFNDCRWRCDSQKWRVWSTNQAAGRHGIVS